MYICLTLGLHNLIYIDIYCTVLFYKQLTTLRSWSCCVDGLVKYRCSRSASTSSTKTPCQRLMDQLIERWTCMCVLGYLQQQQQQQQYTAPLQLPQEQDKNLLICCSRYDRCRRRKGPSSRSRLAGGTATGRWPPTWHLTRRPRALPSPTSSPCLPPSSTSPSSPVCYLLCTLLLKKHSSVNIIIIYVPFLPVRAITFVPKYNNF